MIVDDKIAKNVFEKDLNLTAVKESKDARILDKKYFRGEMMRRLRGSFINTVCASV